MGVGSARGSAIGSHASSKAPLSQPYEIGGAVVARNKGLRIRCNVIQPAAILTPMWEALIGDGPDREAKLAAMVADTPLKRFGTSKRSRRRRCTSPAMPAPT